MTMTEQQTEHDLILAAVTEAFGGTANVGDFEEFEVAGWTVRVQISPDDDRSPLDAIQNDYDVSIWGRLDWEVGDRWSDHARRPDGFTGNAENIGRRNIGVCQGDYVGLWWQPPKEGPKRGTPEFDEFRRNLCDLLTYGFVGVEVEVSKTIHGETCPTCGHVPADHRSGQDSLWGIESFAGDYLLEVAADCIAQAIGEAS